MNVLIGTMLACVTAYTLLEGVFVGRELFGPQHAMTLATITALIGATHAMSSGKGRLKNFVLILFSITCIAYLIIAAGARNAERSQSPEVRLKEATQAAQADLKEARSARERECRSGAGPRCAAARETEAASAVSHSQLQQQLLKVPVAGSGYRSVAMLLAPLLRQDPAAIQGYTTMAMPYAQVVLCELGAALFLLLGMTRSATPSPSLLVKKKKKKKRKGCIRVRPQPPPRPPAQVVVLRPRSSVP